jgi:hypothetical protein
MRLRLAVGLAALVALGIAAPSAFASGVSVNAPATANEGEGMTVHLSGTADEQGLAWAGVVRKEACPATRDEALAQQGPRSNEQSVAMGAFSLDVNLITVDQTGQPLTGFVNVCAYLYRTVGDGATVASASASVQLKPKGTTTGGFGMQIPASQHMSTGGSIHMTATCPNGCTVKVRIDGLGADSVLTKHLGTSNSPVRIKLPLNRPTRGLVRKARKKHKTAKVKVSATATPPSGPKKTASRTVSVS